MGNSLPPCPACGTTLRGLSSNLFNCDRCQVRWQRRRDNGVLTRVEATGRARRRPGR